MKKIISACLLLFVAVFLGGVVSGCSDGNKELKAAVENANSQLAGKFFGEGCYCDGITYNGKVVTYTFSFPGISLGDSAVSNDEFVAMMKPDFVNVFRQSMTKEESAEFYKQIIETNTGVDIRVLFDDKEFLVPFSPDELKEMNL